MTYQADAQDFTSRASPPPARPWRQRARAAAREPLVHFLLLGAMLFWLYAVIVPPDPASRTIIVDQPKLLEYLQYRAKRFDAEGAEIALGRMTPEQREQLVSEYLEQEILYRQALRYGLDRDDDMIKQRIVQKSRFILEAGNRREPTEEELRSYYRNHLNDYTEPQRVTLTHVFFDRTLHGAATKRIAEAAVGSLNAQRAGFSDAREIGDRFPYLVNYVDRPGDYIAEHFGEPFVDEVLKRAPIGRWHGPVESQYGWHGVFVTGRKAAETLPFEQVQDDVARSFGEERAKQQRDESLAKLKRDYDIRIEL